MPAFTHTQRHACKRRYEMKYSAMRGAERHLCRVPRVVGARPNLQEDGHVRVTGHRTEPSERMTANKQACFADNALNRAWASTGSSFVSVPFGAPLQWMLTDVRASQDYGQK